VLLFRPGGRPSVSDIQRLSLANGQFAVTLVSENACAADGTLSWVELLANGLTFDLSGLQGGPAGEAANGIHHFGLAEPFDPASYEAVCLIPGPHLVSGGPMIPVLRCLAWLAAELASLDGVAAICWRSARSLCGPAYFRESISRWLGGGAFPGLGLTALNICQDGSMASEGLALFTGQELHIDPRIAEDQAQAAKLAVRLLHWLVENGRLEERQSLIGPSGETLLLEPRREEGIVWVWRGSR
jgi:hypothetical protein